MEVLVEGGWPTVAAAAPEVVADLIGLLGVEWAMPRRRSQLRIAFEL
ncbi:hypothetical protein [Streptomyces sp. NPDC005784]